MVSCDLFSFLFFVFLFFVFLAGVFVAHGSGFSFSFSFSFSFLHVLIPPSLSSCQDEWRGEAGCVSNWENWSKRLAGSQRESHRLYAI